MRQILLLLFFCTFVCIHGIAQVTEISGKVIDYETKKSLQAITVLLKSYENKIITFKSTNKEGEFVLQTSKQIEGIYLEINHLGYKKKRHDLINKGQTQIIELEESTILLEDVEVKSKPRIQQVGDTLAYNVSSFAQDEDRSIGDVLKRMPGIEVSESGQIKYQGKAISNFYLDGDDLLKDKYRIGTKTIGHKLIQDVEMISNHEHMKVLKNRRYSDDVALNLVTKDEAKISVSGQAKIGIGLPKQYDMELNSVMFNKKYKGLNVLQGNNIGNELKGDLIGFNSSSLLSRLGRTPINNLLDLGTVGNPPIQRAHYLMNNSVGFNANNLYKFKKDWTLTINIQGVLDKSSKEFFGKTTYFTEGGDISFDEKQHALEKEWVGSFNASFAKNIEKYYFNNEFAWEIENAHANASIFSNNSSFELNRDYLIKGFKNKLDYVPALKNGDIIQFGWYFNYGSKPQILGITPGVYVDLLNEDSPYDKINQHVEVPSWLTNMSVGYRLPKGRISQYYSVNITADKQNLNSDISLEDGNSLIPLTAISTQNDMEWSRSSVAALATYDYKHRKLSSQLVLPLAFQHTSYNDPLFQLKENLNKIMFEPAFSSRYNFDAQNELSFNFQRGNTFGNIENVYRGYIVRNYRMIANNTAGINESIHNNFTLNYKSGKAVKLLFYNLGLNYNKSVSSTMISNRIDVDNSQIVLIEQENAINSYGVNAGFDKYIFKWATSLKIGSSVNWTDYNQIFNDELLPFLNTTYSLSPKIETRLWKKLNLSYSGNMNWTKTEQMHSDMDLDQKTFGISQNLSFPLTLYKKFHIQVSGRHLYSHQQALQDINYFFMDSFMRYAHKKWKTDFELRISNIGNNKRFNTYNINANMQSQNSYELRGRMAVLKAVFNFSKTSK
ncbi:carboxypeptidase-like regulatory domain-containing protein [Sphingobacterium cavernae]|uniref:carboxypeptidase-like regulatory domain-containing protein n=1 Tax=Sphingobacterium cavernae TaxID=2592657 RepID=UPI00122FD0E7|nr:carboxypeptidase-like regulatory domain-containing protein [Sphingobacterium cavernae]